MDTSLRMIQFLTNFEEEMDVVNMIKKVDRGLQIDAAICWMKFCCFKNKPVRVCLGLLKEVTTKVSSVTSAFYFQS